MPDLGIVEMPPTGVFRGAYLGTVVAVNDPASLGRVQVRLLSFDGVEDQDAPIWARVAVPFAGGQRGAFMLPAVGDEVLVTLVNGDSRQAVVLGGLWNGANRPPETLGGQGNQIDRWTIVGKAGTRIAIVEEKTGQATIRLSTPGNVSAELTQTASGKIELTAASMTVTLDSTGVLVETLYGSSVHVTNQSIDVNAITVNVNAPQAIFSGRITCQSIETGTITAGVYNSGPGNVW
jgi:uncharacterized protein involved in type VI secretion and phage assembly